MKKIIFIIALYIISFPISAQSLKTLKGKAFSQEILNSNVYTTTGDTLKFSDVINKLKTKVVYIDFWASWCGPCIKEMPESKKIQIVFNEQDVEFLYLSTDVDFKKWKSGLKRIKIKGHHYMLDPDTKVHFKNQFKIKGIPYYIILDKNSNIFDPKAKWPRQDNLLIPDIKNALKIK